MFVKIKQNFCANMPQVALNNLNVQTMNNSKPNDFKQFTM